MAEEKTPDPAVLLKQCRRAYALIGLAENGADVLDADEQKAVAAVLADAEGGKTQIDHGMEKFFADRAAKRKAAKAAASSVVAKAAGVVLLALLSLFATAASATDLSITAANVKVSGSETKTTRGQYGEAVTQGQAVYYDSTTRKYYKADADAANKDAAVGVVLTPGTTDDFGYIVTEGLMVVGATLTVGEIYCVSDAAGGIRPEADNGSSDKVTILGVATTSSVLWVKPFASGATTP